MERNQREQDIIGCFSHDLPGLELGGPHVEVALRVLKKNGGVGVERQEKHALDSRAGKGGLMGA
jgi:hypothetical protein